MSYHEHRELWDEIDANAKKARRADEQAGASILALSEQIMDLRETVTALMVENAELRARIEVLEGAPAEVQVPGEPDEWVPREVYAKEQVE